VRDFVAFEEHVEGVVRSVSGNAGVVAEWYQAPTFYFTNPYALVGAHADVPVPPGCRLLDFELEVAVVVGRDGASLTAEQAREHVFGYTIFNDWSARDLQRGRCGSTSARPRVRTSPARSARGWSPPTSWSRTATPTASSAWTCGCRSTAWRSGRTCCRTWAGRSRS
jgi:2-keto-4-pentenoate hydratase/2-oxohepta-3-ene-1,7-dioic acid hydratase in catechol pathway